MTVESANFVNQFVSANPAGTDAKSEGDDHIRLIKNAIVASFPNIGGPVGAASADLAAMGDGIGSVTASNCTTSGFLRKGVDGLLLGYIKAVQTTTILGTWTLPAGFRPTVDCDFVGTYVDNSGGGAGTILTARFTLTASTGAMALVSWHNNGSPGTPGIGDQMLVPFAFPTR
jgi:hypothetical protein